MRTRAIRATAVALLALALTATTACSTKARDGSGGAGELATGTGVTGDTITLGVLTDLHGVFAATGTTLTNAQKLYWKQVNQNGGICDGRRVKLEVKDHGYDVQQAVTLYNQLRGNVLALQQSLGSPMTTALLSSYERDSMLTIPASWAGTMLTSPTIMIVGATYQLEMINGIDYLLEEGMIEPGDTIGHIYLEGEYGENGLQGARFAAGQNDLEIRPAKIQADDTDVSAQITDFDNAGVDAVLLTTTPTQAASAASAMEAAGYDAPILGQGPTWAPELLDTAAAKALRDHYHSVGGALVPSADEPAVRQFVEDYKDAYPDAPVDQGATFGFSAAAALAEVIKEACARGDLTRQGLVDAFRSKGNLKTDMLPPLDYTERGQSPTDQVYVFRASEDALGGQEIVSEGLYEGKDASRFSPDRER